MQILLTEIGSRRTYYDDVEKLVDLGKRYMFVLMDGYCSYVQKRYVVRIDIMNPESVHSKTE